jgi:hypothetical protein
MSSSPDSGFRFSDDVLIVGLAVTILGLIPGFIVLADDGSWGGFIPSALGAVAVLGALAVQTYEYQKP